MNAVTIRQDAPTTSNEVATTWDKYLAALTEYRAHRKITADRIHAEVDAALERARQLQRTAKTLRNQR